MMITKTDVMEENAVVSKEYDKTDTVKLHLQVLRVNFTVPVFPLSLTPQK